MHHVGVHRQGWLVGIGLAALIVAGVAGSDEPPTQSTTPAASSNISAEELIASPFAEFFKSGDYPRALAALDDLSKRYPNDPLLLRYRAICLDRLGRYDEAIDIYRELLQRDPNHVPTRFFLAQAYYRKGERDKARQEWEWVAQNSPAKEYRDWSREILQKQETRASRPVERRKFYLFGNLGWEYDTNVPLKSNDQDLGTAGDKNANRFPLNLGIGYRAVQKPDLRFDVIYTARQSLHDDSLDQFNFTSQEIAFDGRKRVSVWDKDVTLGARYEYNAGWLDGNLFSMNHEWLLSTDVRLTPRTRTYVYNRFTWSEYGPDGSNPPQTSRDGFYYDLGITQYLYSANYRSWVFIGEEFEDAETRGDNFERHGTTTRFGVHTPVPVVERTDFDASAGYRWAQYPDFSSLSARDSDQRKDSNWDMYVALTHHITPRLATRGFYRMINANNENDFFQYDRHIFGMHLLFTQYF